MGEGGGDGGGVNNILDKNATYILRDRRTYVDRRSTKPIRKPRFMHGFLRSGFNVVSGGWGGWGGGVNNILDKNAFPFTQFFPRIT